MNPIIPKLQTYISENPPSYGDGDAHSILEMLYCYYRECNSTDSEPIKEEFETLYHRMNGLSLREMDKIIDVVCSLCREHEKSGFIEGIKVGIQLWQEIKTLQ